MERRQWELNVRWVFISPGLALLLLPRLSIRGVDLKGQVVTSLVQLPLLGQLLDGPFLGVPPGALPLGRQSPDLRTVRPLRLGHEEKAHEEEDQEEDRRAEDAEHDGVVHGIVEDVRVPVHCRRGWDKRRSEGFFQICWKGDFV